MDETRMHNAEVTEGGDVHVPASEVAGAHDSDGTMGRVAGTGSGAVSGGVIGAAVGGPIGAVIGAVAGGALGSAAGEAAHHVGDDHDDVNVETGRDGDGARVVGSGTGGISGAVVGGAAGGPLGAVVGAVAGGMLGAEAGDVTKDMGNDNNAVGTTVTNPDYNLGRPTSVETEAQDTRGTMERIADAATGDRIDDNTGRAVI